MLIIGAKGYAKELLEVVLESTPQSEVFLYDDINPNIGERLYDRFKIINNIESASNHFKNLDIRFALGIGNPLIRELMSNKFINIGGQLTTIISNKTSIGTLGTSVLEGTTIMQGTVITNDVKIGKGCLININCTIGHDSIINDYVELCPGVHVSGNSTIGKFTFVGTNSSILPNITIGENVVIAAGTIVNKNVPDNCMIAGVPGVIKKTRPKLK